MYTSDIKNNCFQQVFDSISNNRFVKSMAHSCVVKTLTLGISLVAKQAMNLGERAVSWILERFGLSKKADEFAIPVINRSSTNNDKPTKPSKTAIRCQSLVVNPAIASLPNEIALEIFKMLFMDWPSISCVSHNWSAMANDDGLYGCLLEHLKKKHTINGAEAYEEVYKKAYPNVSIKVKVAEEFRLPKGIYRYLEENQQGFMITFITDEIIIENNGEVQKIVFESLEAVGNFFKNPVTDLETCFTAGSCEKVIKEKRSLKPHWSIISKEGMYKNETFPEQLRLSGKRVARLMDTAISVLMVYARSGCKERLFVWDPQNGKYTLVRFGDEDKSEGRRPCLGFGPSGLNVGHGFFDYALKSIGVVPAR